MSTHALPSRAAGAHRLPVAAAQQLRWLAAGLAFGFLVPFLFADLLELPRDLYYAVYSVGVFAFFVLWSRRTSLSLAAMVRRRLPLTLGLGLVFAGVMTLVVLRAEEATARPDGLALAGAVLWRGVVYGAADGLLLSAFPILAVFAAFAGHALRKRLGGTLLIGAAAIAASLAMTAAYHAGYGEFRSAKVANPVAGDVVWSAPTLLTLNPVGAPIAHAGMHVAAVLHSSETDLFLPPHR